MRKMRSKILWFWLWLLLWACGGCSSLHASRKVSAENTRAVAPAQLSLKRNDWSHFQPLQMPSLAITQLGMNAPQESKDHTYLFFINGFDPYYLANFRGQCQYMKTLGYNNAYSGQMNHTELFRHKIWQIRKADTQARVVVVGYSTGANCARTLVNQLKEDAVRIDLLVYIGGDTIKDEGRSRPPNVNHVLNIIGHAPILFGGDLILRGYEIKGASNHRLDALHFKLPTRAEATELLVRHVVDLHRNLTLDRRDALLVPAQLTTSDGLPINPRSSILPVD